MQKHFIVFLSVIMVLCFSACGFNRDVPDTVTIEGKEYKKAFVEELYPFSEPGDGIRILGTRYSRYSKTPYDCYIAYDRNAEPNIFFLKEQFDEAKKFYSDHNNFNFFCLFGNIHDEDEQQIISLENIDGSMFNSLLEFSAENNYNPFTSFNNEENLKKIPVADSDDWMADEIHFYKESKDGAFSTSRGYTFVLFDNKLHLLYEYDFSDENAIKMVVRDIPSEIGDYFCALLKAFS